jgi:hypothetical protein
MANLIAAKLALTDILKDRQVAKNLVVAVVDLTAIRNWAQSAQFLMAMLEN